MRAIIFALTACLVLAVGALGGSHKETIEEAALRARRIVYHEGIGTLSTTYIEQVSAELAGQPFSLMDYTADCSEDGSPSLIFMTVQVSYKNFVHGSKMTLALREHPSEPVYSIARLPRLALFGNVTEVTDPDERSRVYECYIDKHPDAAFWAPGRDIHPASWYKFNVEQVYYFGGFGNESLIGFLPMDLYKNVSLEQIRENSAGQGRLDSSSAQKNGLIFSEDNYFSDNLL